VKARRILHHSVNVEGRLAEAEAFYTGVLGLEIEPGRPDIPGVGGRWFRVGDAQIHLVDAPIADAPVRTTDAHVCLAVDDIDAAIASLESEGIPYERASQGPVVQIFIADPVGNIIELQQAHIAPE
jgi:catechol 2,3-dioxygenase-like lactoylglutathione lyase family enzyme